MKKAEAEAAIRSLATRWASETNYVVRSGWYPIFMDFEQWLTANGYDRYLRFRSSASPAYDAEKWFEDELKRWPIRSNTDE